jgi:hypothetical protein
MMSGAVSKICDALLNGITPGVTHDHFNAAGSVTINRHDQRDWKDR